MNYEKMFLNNKMNVDNDGIVFIAEDISHLFQAVPKFKSYDLNILMRLPSGSVYRSCIKYDNKFLLFPQGNGLLCIYYIDENKVEYKHLPNNLHNKDENNWSARYFLFEDSLYFNWQNPVVTKYDLKKHEWTIYRDWKDNLPKGFDTYQWFMGDAFAYKGGVYFHIGKTEYFLKIIHETGETNVIRMKFSPQISNKDIVLVRFTDESIWLQTTDNNIVGIYKVSIEKLNIESVCEIPVDKITRDIFPIFTIMEVLDETMYLLPGEYDKAYVINLKNGTYKEFSDIEIVDRKHLSKTSRHMNFFYGERVNDILYTFNISNGVLVMIDLKNGKVSNIAGLFDKDKLKEYFFSVGMKERFIFNLEDLIEYVVKRQII